MSDLVQGWFDIRSFDNGVTMIGEPQHYEDVKSYLIEGTTHVAIVDTGMGVGDFPAIVASLTDRAPIVLQSHAHFDHIGASSAFDRVFVHPSEADDLALGYPNEKLSKWCEPAYLNGPLPVGFDPQTASIQGVDWALPLVAGDEIDLGGRIIEVFHTPGHSPGGLSFLAREARILFPGDAIYAGPMFAYREGSDPAAYRDSLRLLAELAAIVDHVYPSHNRVPLMPNDVITMHEAYEQVWTGREPDSRFPDHDVFDFGDFSFWLPPQGA